MAKKILVIDDEAHVVKMVESRLKANGYATSGAGSGKEGLAKAKKERPDLILLDIIMPEMDGQEVLKKLREDEKTRSIPVIMLTAKGAAEDIVASIAQGGAVDYIVKPYIAADFLKKINRFINAAEKVPEDSCEKELWETVAEKVKKVLGQNT